MNSPKHSCARDFLVVVDFETVQSSLLIVATIILVAATAIAQDPVAFHEKPASQPLITSINFVNEANALGRAHRWPEAVDIYLKALRLDPNNATAQNNLGHAYVELGRLDDAARCLEDAVKLQPDNSLFRYNLGNTYLLIRQVPRAIEQLREAIQLRESYPEAHNDLGNAYLDNGDYKNALASFARTIELNPNFAPAYNGLGVAYHRLSRFEEARTALLKGVARTWIRSNYNTILAPLA